MVDSLLRLHHVVRDPVGGTAALRAVLGSAEVTATGPLTWDQVSLVDDGISIVSLRAAGTGVHATITKSAELVVVLVREGSLVFRNGEHRLELGPDELGLLPIGATGHLEFGRVHLELFTFPPAPLARLLGVPRHAVRLRAPRADPRSPALAEYFRRVAHLLTSSVFGVPEVYARDLVRVHTIDALTAVLVDAFELTNRSEDRSDRDAAILRRAVAEFRDHLAEPISIPEVAHAAGVSVRGLQMVFQRQLGVSPLLHLRQLRLEAAREALIREAETGTTVADIARRFGYSNSGRFSTHYRDAYGESPAASLIRVRSAPRSPAADGPSEAEVVHTPAPEAS